MGCQMKMAHSEKQVAELTRSLDMLMREKKELEIKERIMRDSLNGITIHMDHLFADKVRIFYSLQADWGDIWGCKTLPPSHLPFLHPFFPL